MSLTFTLELTLEINARPDEVEAALRNAGAWAGRMVERSLPAELETIRWAIPNIACVKTATLTRECNWKKALADKAAENARRSDAFNTLPDDYEVN